MGSLRSCWFCFFFWLHQAACGILFPQPGIEPAPLALKAWASEPLDHLGSPTLAVFKRSVPKQLKAELRASCTDRMHF